MCQGFINLGFSSHQFVSVSYIAYFFDKIFLIWSSNDCPFHQFSDFANLLWVCVSVFRLTRLFLKFLFDNLVLFIFWFLFFNHKLVCWKNLFWGISKLNELRRWSIVRILLRFIVTNDGSSSLIFGFLGWGFKVTAFIDWYRFQFFTFQPIDYGLNYSRHWFCLRKFLKNWNQHEQLIIVFVKVPWFNRNRIKRMHWVSNWRVIYDD